MKEVVIYSNPVATIEAHSCSLNRFYGVFKEGEPKNVLLRLYPSDRWDTFSLVARGEGISLFMNNPTDNFVDAVRKLRDKGYTVYHFDSQKELAEWLAK